MKLLTKNEILCISGGGEEQACPQKGGMLESLPLSPSQWTSVAVYATGYMLTPHLPENPQGMVKNFLVPALQTGAVVVGYAGANLFFQGAH